MELEMLTMMAKMKTKPGVFFGRKSLMSLRDQLWGMMYAFDICGHEEAMKYFRSFTETYNAKLLEKGSCSAWWHHILNESGESDEEAFDLFFRRFECFLWNEYGLKLPEGIWEKRNI